MSVVHVGNIIFFCSVVSLNVNIMPAFPLIKIYLIIVIEKAVVLEQRGFKRDCLWRKKRGDSPFRGNVALRQKGCRLTLVDCVLQIFS